MFWVISIYFNIRNILPKSGTFLLGHPVYVVHKCPDHHSYVFMKGMEQTAHKAYLEFCHFYGRIRNINLKVMVSTFCHIKQSKPHFFIIFLVLLQGFSASTSFCFAVYLLSVYFTYSVGLPNFSSGAL